MCASPQKENGYTPIANEIMEALARTPIGLGNRQILDAILRKTYGWNKKEDSISITQLEEATGLSRRMVIYCLQNLETQRVILIKRKVGRGIKNEINIISFQKNYHKWVVQENSSQYRNILKNRKLYYKNKQKGVVQENGGSARNGHLVVQENKKNSGFLAPTKDIIQNTYTKENTTIIARDYFYSSYKQAFNQDYVADFSKDGTIFKKLLEIISLDKLKLLIDKFFISTDKFILESGYTTGVFKTQINKLQITKPKPHYD